MDEGIVATKLQCAVGALFRHQQDIFTFTVETHQTEWNLAHHLANEIQRVFPKLQCDLDLVKVNFENRRPDIVVHRRGSQESNVLVVEVKHDGADGEVEADVEKIRRHWFMPPLRYRFGAVINLRTNGRHTVRVIKNENP